MNERTKSQQFLKSHTAFPQSSREVDNNEYRSGLQKSCSEIILQLHEIAVRSTVIIHIISWDFPAGEKTACLRKKGKANETHRKKGPQKEAPEEQM